MIINDRNNGSYKDITYFALKYIFIVALQTQTV